MLARLSLTRHHLVHTVRYILPTSFLDREHLSMVVEKFLTVFTALLSEKSFLVDYD